MITITHTIFSVSVMPLLVMAWISIQSQNAKHARPKAAITRSTSSLIILNILIYSPQSKQTCSSYDSLVHRLLQPRHLRWATICVTSPVSLLAPTAHIRSSALVRRAQCGLTTRFTTISRIGSQAAIIVGTMTKTKTIIVPAKKPTQDLRVSFLLNQT